MTDFNQIKLIIWDLDDTFWQGTLSEGGIEPIPDHIDLVKQTTACGIINSICSKNDPAPVLEKLEELGVKDYFVFSSIDWTPKGQRIAKILSSMSLRAVNTLFIDDNQQNLEEAKYYAPELQTASPQNIPDIIEFIRQQPQTDPEHTRLQQYQTLEKKRENREQYSDNIEFLYSTNTQVDILYDSLSQIDRIHELLQRSNQLNYTKIRPTLEELRATIENPGTTTGYVKVSDKFGDYGIVGFFAIQNGECLHFTFSCRAIGQGVEQYVYATLGYPALKTIEPVVSYVDHSEAPRWINQENRTPSDMAPDLSTIKNHKLLFKGPCDMALISSYLEQGNYIETEFTYVSDRGNSIEQHNHSTHILQLRSLNDQDKQTILAECRFADNTMFSTHLFDVDLDIVFFSTLPELNLGIYRRKDSQVQVVFGEWTCPLTDPANWPDLVDEKVYTGFNKFTYDYLQDFAAKYEFLGRLTADQSAANIEKIFAALAPHTVLVLILGVELPFEQNHQAAYKNRHLEHKELNDKLRSLAAANQRIKLLDLNDFVQSQDDFTNNINHFSKRVYYNLAQEAIRITEASCGITIKQKSKGQLMADNLVAKLRSRLNPRSRIYYILKRLYHSLRH